MTELTPRPETFDPWQFAAWVKRHENDLYVKLKDPKSQQLGLKSLAELSPDQWAFYAQRLFMDPRAQVKTKEAWESL